MKNNSVYVKQKLHEKRAGAMFTVFRISSPLMIKENLAQPIRGKSHGENFKFILIQ